MSELTTKAACAIARRKMQASLKRIGDLEGLFSDLDDCLAADAARMVSGVRAEFEKFANHMADGIQDQESRA